jgi:hypothetical protein
MKNTTSNVKSGKNNKNSGKSDVIPSKNPQGSSKASEPIVDMLNNDTPPKYKYRGKRRNKIDKNEENEGAHSAPVPSLSGTTGTEQFEPSLIELLPSHVFYHIREYSSHIDYLNFMNINKRQFRSIKHDTVYYSFNNTFSKMFVESFPFRNLIYERIRDSAMQVGLTIEHLPTSELALPNLRKLNILDCSDKRIRSNDINEISYLRLAKNDTLTVLTGLKSIIKLCLVGFNMLNDVSSLSFLKGLELRECGKISDLSSLSNLIKLTVSHCYNITNDCIPYLRKIRFLTFISCPSIRNISSLVDVYELKIITCSNVEFSDFISNNIKLTIFNCHQLLNCYQLRNVKNINISNCLRCMEGPDLRSNCTTVTLENLPSLGVGELKIFPKNLQNLYLNNIHIAPELEQLRHLHRLKIKNCSTFDCETIACLGNIPFLSFENCETLNSIIGLGGKGQEYVSIIECHAVNNFSWLKNVPHVRIIRCGGFNTLSLQSFCGVIHLELDTLPKTITVIPDLTSLKWLSITSCPFLKTLLCSKVEKVEFHGELGAMDNLIKDSFLIKDNSKYIKYEIKKTKMIFIISNTRRLLLQSS